MKKQTLTLILCTLLPLTYVTILSSIHIKHIIKTHHHTPISQTLTTIPEKDRLILTDFFKTLLVQEHFAYTLFGDKPISISNCLCTRQTSPFLHTHWQTWEKYQHLFPSDTYTLRLLTAPTKEEAWILLLHKKQFLKTIKQHRRLFRVMIGNTFTEDDLLHTFLTSPNPIKQGLKNHTTLIGILLGYGKNNAALYSRKEIIESALLVDSSTTLTPNHPFHSLEDELQELTHILRPFTCAGDVPYPCERFLADHSTQETQDLIKKYRKANDDFAPILSSDHFLELFLTHFTAP